VSAAAGFGICIWVLSRRLLLQRSVEKKVRPPISKNGAFSSEISRREENSRNFFGCVVDIATSLSTCCHSFRECCARSFQSALGEGLQFSQFSLFRIESAGSKSQSEKNRMWSSPNLRAHLANETGKQNSRLRLSRQRPIHLHRIERAVHALTQHINDINTGRSIVIVVVAANLRWCITAGSSRVGSAGVTTAAVSSAGITQLRRRHASARDGIVEGWCFGWHGDGEGFVRSGMLR
jgi:hypothetical protein